MESLLNSRLGGYVLTRLVAAGGMAAVFEAEHEVTRQPVAIKVLSRDLRNRKDPLARILQEGRVICSLLHEHIVRVLDYGIADDGVGFVVMELLSGRTLAEVLTAEKRLAPGRAVFVGRQVCSGLAAAHARGVYHRDIKPANIMLVDGQRHRDFVKLLDFGIAKLDAGDPAKLAATATGMTLGTPCYMSPEQARAEPIDARSDVYQLGIVLYEALVGHPPFTDRNPVNLMGRHLTEQPRSLRSQRPDVPVELENVVLKCLEKRPDDRYQTAEALRDVLDQLAERDTAGERYATLVPSQGHAPVVGNLRLPTLGSPADLERYARNLSAVLAQLWPSGDVPEDLRVIQGAIWTLSEQQMQLGTDLALAREEADALARGIEARLVPLERAIEALEAEKAALEERLRDARTRERQHELRTQELDAEYARLYEEVEGHQATLYASAAGEGLVDFRELFREDIAARLDGLERIYRRRSQEAERLNTLRREIAEVLPRIADYKLQLCGLRQSRLSIEAERAGRLAGREFEVIDLENRHRALERALEHRYLQLGLAFRRAVSKLLEAR